MNQPKQALERTAARLVFTFQMVKAVSLKVVNAPASGRSAFLR